MDIEEDRMSDDDLQEVSETRVKKIPEVEVRKDIAEPRKFEHYMQIESDVLFEQKPSSDKTLKEESEEIYTSKKVRKHLYDQAVNKARWRRGESGNITSNARFVKWSDGTCGVYIGEQYYDLDANSTANSHVALQATKDLILSVAQLTQNSTLRVAQDLTL